MSSDKPQSIFRSLSSKQCLEVYEPIRQNAKRHFVAADALANQDDFSNAIAHLILGAEELLKSLMILLQGLEFPVRDVANYDKLFYNHNARHNLLKEFHSMYVFIRFVVEGRPAQKVGQTRVEYWTHTIVHGLQSAKKGFDNYEWWNKADKLKQNCFYVDYTTDGVANPCTINREDWLEAHQFVSAFVIDINELMVKLANASPHVLSEYKNDFDTAELGQLMAESINRKKPLF